MAAMLVFDLPATHADAVPVRPGQTVLIRPAYDNLLSAYYFVYDKQDASVIGLVPKKDSREIRVAQPEKCAERGNPRWDFNTRIVDRREDRTRRFVVVEKDEVIQLRFICDVL